MQNEKVISFSFTETGYNHIKANKICEDASDFYDDENMHICVIADGHGSDNYPRTDRGAKYAVKAALNCIKEFVENANSKEVLDDENNNFTLLLQLSKSILNKWHISIEEDYNQNPFCEKELEKVSEKYRKLYLSSNEETMRIEKAYGCTLIAFAVTTLYSFGMQIGDGKCVIIDRFGDFSEPIPWDENCQLNVTTSICDSNSIEEFRFFISNQSPVAVFCGSDGIDDSYANSEELYALYRSILKIFVENGEETGKKEIIDFLPILTKKGSGDDVSVGVIIDMMEAVKIGQIIELQSQIFKFNTDLTRKKEKIITTVEKKERFLKKLNNNFVSGMQISDIAEEIDKLTIEATSLREETELIQNEINECERILQEYLYEKQKAYFDEMQVNSKNAENNIDNVLEESGTDVSKNITSVVGSDEKKIVIQEIIEKDERIFLELEIKDLNPSMTCNIQNSNIAREKRAAEEAVSKADELSE